MALASGYPDCNVWTIINDDKIIHWTTYFKAVLRRCRGNSSPTEFIMKHDPRTHWKGSPKRAYDYGMTRARRQAVKAFVILLNAFHVLHKQLQLKYI